MTSYTKHGGVHQPQIAEIPSPQIRSLWPFKVPPPSGNLTTSQTGNAVPRAARELYRSTWGRSQLGVEEREDSEGQGGGRGEEGGR